MEFSNHKVNHNNVERKFLIIFFQIIISGSFGSGRRQQQFGFSAAGHGELQSRNPRCGIHPGRPRSLVVDYQQGRRQRYRKSYLEKQTPLALEVGFRCLVVVHSFVSVFFGGSEIENQFRIYRPVAVHHLQIHDNSIRRSADCLSPGECIAFS